MHTFPHMSTSSVWPQNPMGIQRVTIIPETTRPLPITPSNIHFLFAFFSYFLKKIYVFILLFGCGGSLLLFASFPLVAGKRGYSLAVVCGLLMASFIAEQGLQGARDSVVAAWGFGIWGSWALGCWLCSLAHGLSCSAVSGLFPDQGSNRCPVHYKATCSEKCRVVTTREFPSFCISKDLSVCL